MIHWSDIFNQQFVLAALPALGVMIFGLLGYLIYGGLYFIIRRRREGRPISARLILTDVFPRELYAHYSSKVDMWIFFPVVFLFAPLATFVVTIAGLMIGTDISTTLNSAFGTHAAISAAPWVIITLQFVVYLLGYDFGQYVSHYALHRVPLLWAIHRAHHSAETLTFFTNPRAHPLELIILVGARLACASIAMGVLFHVTGTQLLPQTTTALTFYNIAFLGSYTMLTHSHIPISFGGRFNILIGGPVMHQIHHSAEIHHRDTNLGGAPGHIFDWMFGTLYLPKKGETFRVGLNDEEYGDANPYRSAKDFYLEPFVYGWRHIRTCWFKRHSAQDHRALDAPSTAPQVTLLHDR